MGRHTIARKKRKPQVARWFHDREVDDRPRPTTIAEVFDERGKIFDAFCSDKVVLTQLERRQAKGARQAMKKLSSQGKGADKALTLGIRCALRQGFVWNQLIKQYPWAVYVMVDGKVKRKKCTTLGDAVYWWSRLVKRYPNATIVSLARSYDIPDKLRGKLPRPWKWCPRCLKARKFRKKLYDGQEATFYTLRKEWSDEKGRYEWMERKLYVTECPMCGCTNRDPVMRRSNQEFHTRKFKRGVRTASRKKSMIDPKPTRKKRRVR